MLYNFVKFHSHELFFLRTHDEMYSGNLLTVGLLSILIPKGGDLSSYKKLSDLLVNRYPVSPEKHMMQDEGKHIASEHSTTEQVRYKYRCIKTYIEFSPPKALFFYTGNVYWGSGRRKGAFYSSW